MYKNADVLILDEATSALDIETENEIIKEIKDLKGSMTIIMVTHRITSLKNCDHIIEIKNKKITTIR